MRIQHKEGSLGRRMLCAVTPTFLGIGGQKTGSTWLYLQLDRHPEVSFGRGDPGGGLMRKERHFWCRPLHRRVPDRPTISEWPRPDDLDRYLRSFDVPESITGEISPHYAVMPRELVETVHRHLTDVRLVYVVRDPRRRAWSQAWSRLSKRGKRRGINLPTVWDRSTDSDQPLDDESIAFLAEVLGQRGVKVHSDFGPVIDRWASVFGGDRLLVLRSDAFRDDPRGSLATVYRHIGADPGFSHEIPETELAQWVNPHRPSPGAIPEELRPVLDEIYLPMVDRLEAATGWDLSEWRR